MQNELMKRIRLGLFLLFLFSFLLLHGFLRDKQRRRRSSVSDSRGHKTKR
jgi:hypothetical protein